MVHPNKFIFIIFLASLISSCQKHEENSVHERSGYEAVNLTRATTDVMLPAELWDRMESIYHTTHMTGFGSSGEKGNEESSAAEKKEGISQKIEIPTQYMALKAFLTEKDVDALGGKNFELTFGLGGGELDLKDFVKKGKKQFAFAVQIDEPFNPKDTLKVFFLSNSKSAKVGNTEWGAGCQKYMDVTTYFTKTLSRQGVLVTAADLRYLRVIAGSFFFVLNKNNSLYLAQLKVTDSRYKNIFCRT